MTRPLQVMRQYGSFLVNLLNDHSGQTVLNQADQLERLLKAKTVTSSSTTQQMTGDEIFLEQSAVITISCLNDKQFGVISNANMGACNMFGCSVGDLVGAPISSIIPAPFNAMHDGFLHSYLQAERTSTFISRAQHMFACRRNGTIFPVVLRIRQVSGGLQGSVFIAVVTEIKVSATEQYLLYDASTRRITAVSAGCAALLGVDVQSLNSTGSAVKLDTVLPGLQALNLVEDAPTAHSAGTLIVTTMCFSFSSTYECLVLCFDASSIRCRGR